jgi:hypothetical protein
MTTQIKTLDSDDALHCQYTGQTSPQPCYLELDPEAETAHYDYSGEIGNAVPFPVWHGRLRRYHLPAAILASTAARLSDELRPLLDRVVAGYSERWDDSDHVGSLDDDAAEAEAEIERLLESIDSDDLVRVWDAGDWMAGIGNSAVQAEEIGITAATTDEQLVGIGETLEASARSEGVHVLEGVEGYLEEIRQDRIDDAE